MSKTERVILNRETYDDLVDTHSKIIKQLKDDNDRLVKKIDIFKSGKKEVYFKYDKIYTCHGCIKEVNGFSCLVDKEIADVYNEKIESLNKQISDLKKESEKNYLIIGFKIRRRKWVTI